MKSLVEKIKKCVVLEDEALYWLQNWTAASLLNVKAIEIKLVFLAKRLVFPNKVSNEINKSCIMM